MDKKQIRPFARLHGWWLCRTQLARMAGWPPEKRAAWLFERLRNVLVSAQNGIPFYRDRFRLAGFAPERDFLQISDLSRVPILTKDEVRSHSQDLIDPRHLRGSVDAYTSGTTGQPTRLRLNESYVALDYACMYRHWGQAGYRMRDRFAAIRSYVPDSSEGPLWRISRPQNTLYMSAYHLKPANADAYLDALLRFRPSYLRGYVSSVATLAEFAYPRRQEFEFVRGVFTASETLSEPERATIERTFGKKLFDWYGMTEPAVVITERLDHDGMEVNWEYGYPEFLSGDDLPAGERRLVATSLHNPVMPLIRYETGDLALLSERLDSAGLYPRIAAMRGRKDDCILTPDGRRLPSLNFYSLLQPYRELLRFQFIQTDLESVTMKVSIRPGTMNVGPLLSQLREEVMKRLGTNLSLTIEMTDQFLTSADGKTPTFQRLAGVSALATNSRRDAACAAQSTPHH